MRKNYYTPKEISVLTGHTLDNVWRWLREHKIKAEKIVGRVYIIAKTKEIEDWIKLKKK